MFSLLHALETYVNHYHFLISEDHRSITWFSAFQKMNKTIDSAPARRSFTLESGFHPDKTTAYIKLKNLQLIHHFSTRLNFKLWSGIFLEIESFRESVITLSQYQPWYFEDWDLTKDCCSWVLTFIFVRLEYHLRRLSAEIIILKR